MDSYYKATSCTKAVVAELNRRTTSVQETLKVIREVRVEILGY